MGLVGALIAVVGMAGAGPATAARPTRRSVERAVYGHDDGEALTLYVYPTASRKPSPAIVVLHGGGWVAGSSAQLAPEARALAKAGYVVFDVNYLLATAGHPGYPGQIADVERSIEWIATHGKEYGARPGRVGLLGASAGAYLAAMVGVEDPRAVGAVVTLSAPTDLTDLVLQATRESRGRCTPECLARKARHIDVFLGCNIIACPRHLLVSASPIYHVTSRCPPFFVVNGTHELVPVQQAIELVNRLRRVRVPVEVRLVPGSRHGLRNALAVRGPVLSFFHKYVRGKMRNTSDWEGTMGVVGLPVLVLAILLAVGFAWRRRERSSNVAHERRR